MRHLKTPVSKIAGSLAAASILTCASLAPAYADDGADGKKPDASMNQEMDSMAAGIERMPELMTRRQVYLFADAFYRFLVRGKGNDLRKICTPTFYFEDRQASDDEGFAAELGRLQKSRRGTGLKVKRMQVFSAEEMERAFGKPPVRLAGWPTSDKAYFSVAEIGEEAVVVMWLPQGEGGLYYAAALHD